MGRSLAGTAPGRMRRAFRGESYGLGTVKQHVRRLEGGSSSRSQAGGRERPFELRTAAFKAALCRTHCRQYPAPATPGWSKDEDLHRVRRQYDDVGNEHGRENNT